MLDKILIRHSHSNNAYKRSFPPIAKRIRFALNKNHCLKFARLSGRAEGSIIVARLLQSISETIDEAVSCVGEERAFIQF